MTTVPVIAPAPWILPDGAPRRAPTRPPEGRGPDYLEKFDADTLLYDLFLDRGGRRVVGIGPPLANLADAFAGSAWRALPGGEPVTFRIIPRDRGVRIEADVPLGTEGLAVSGPLGEQARPVAQDRTGLFAGRRVILTLSRNNDLAWIKDWIRYNRDVHGADGVLFYDNASTAYSTEELADAIGSVGGIAARAVVPWPFKYGPQGSGSAYWDSDFCQHGVLEHARRHFLASARSVLNSDIDELVVGPSGHSVFAAAERSLTGMALYPGVWVYGLVGIPPPKDAGAHSYAPFRHYLDPEKADRVLASRGYLANKWAVVPRRCPDGLQWATHTIIGWRFLYAGASRTTRFVYRHYRELSTNWKHDRSRRPAYVPGVFVEDEAAAQALARVDWSR
jgi:hypothetical protein